MKSLRLGLCGLLLVLALALIALGALLGSGAGSLWLLGRVPGLQVEGFSGRLAGAWQAERLNWRQGERSVELSDVELVWRPACLLQLTLCVERLVVGQASLAWPPGEDGAGGPRQLPALQLPFPIRLGEARLGRLLLNGREQVGDLQLSAQWSAEGIRIDVLKARRDGWGVDLQGHLTPTAGWPLTASGSLALPAPGGQPWALAVQVDGDLQERLRLQADSQGYLTGRLSGDIRPLAEQLPVSLKLTADGFKAAAGLPDTLRLEQIELALDGDLQEGYAVQGKARLPGEGGAVALALQGRVKSDGAELAALRLDAGGAQRLELAGRLGWRDGLAGELRLDWRDFPWRRLYPTRTEPAVSLKRFTGELSYRDGGYLGNFDAELQGPAGPFSLASPLSGDFTQLHLPQLKLVAGQGRAQGVLGLRFADGIGWNADLQLSGLDPAYWLAELAGSLGGPLKTQGRFRDGRLQLDAAVDLSGRLRGQRARLLLEGQGADDAWSLAKLDLALGDNRIQGSGQLGERLGGRLELALPQLGQLWPGLQGSANGRLDLAGTPAAPQGTLDLAGRRLRLGARRLDSLKLAASLDAAQRGRMALDAGGIQFGDTRLGRLQALGQGDRRTQTLTVDLDGPQLVLVLAFDGRLEALAQGWNWRGRLSRGELRSGGQDWRLQGPARLERLADGRLSLGAHCWRSGPASLCGEDQRLLPESQLNYRLRDFPLDSLAAWWPQDFAWQGRLNGELQLELPAAGPRGQVRLDAGNGVLRLREKGRWQDFPYRQLLLDSRLQPQRIDARLVFAGPRLGELDVAVQIDPQGKNKPLSGRFALRGLELGVLRPFAGPVEELDGTLDGNGTLRGSLLQPLIDGRLELRGGRIAGSGLPIRFEDLGLQAQIAGDRLQLSGGWRSGEHGQGSLDGTLDWRQAPDLDLRVRGSRLPVSVPPYAELEVAPDLRVRLAGETADRQLALSGALAVPRGAITLRELPVSTVRVSEDAVVAGREVEPRRQLAMRMDIEVEVGKDKLTFSGFGLTSELAGHLHIGDQLDTRGELSLNKGRYRAYGQRLDIRRARLLFIGPIDQPYLDIEAVRTVDDVVAGLRVGGSVLEPRTDVFAEPAMSQEQALSYLLLGRAPGSSDSADSNQLAGAALGLGLAGSSSITGGLAKNLGIEEFELGTQGSGTTTSVVASGKLSERLSLIYGVGVFEPVNSIALRYQLTRRLFLEAASGLASSLDLFYKQDF
ncbi:translocation and assembly module TamB [Azotobacter beijerinckii]|uniref:Translocation and assembly module TamB n=1 Tax=Azotobacter beijerinckii TaxID=170623 RepID=A0A1H6S078_9GAMM|nr:translocation/assembly module TamB domain-containing protein [Azotobacter beijerinckii]SEI60086.1 translocation and assembly module TamB [Azotobacter beijerinckii]